MNSVDITNEDIYNILESQIEDLGYKVYDVQNESNFEFNYFKVKGFKNWRFGIYIRSYYMEGTKNPDCVHFFTKHNDNIDKFRPSSAVWKYSETVDAFTGEWSFFKGMIKEKLQAINRHPIFAFLFDGYGEEWYFKAPPIVKYISDRLYRKWNRFKYR